MSRRSLAIFVIAVAVNYVWELAQAPLYGPMEGAIWWHCFVASIGDGVIVLLIFAIGAGLRRTVTGSSDQSLSIICWHC